MIYINQIMKIIGEVTEETPEHVALIVMLYLFKGSVSVEEKQTLAHYFSRICNIVNHLNSKGN